MLLRTLEQWEPLTSLALPSAIRALMAATYTEKQLPPGWETLYEADYGEKLADTRLADLCSDIWQESLDDDTVSLRTRLSGDDVLMTLCSERDGSRVTLPEDGRGSLDVARRLHRNAVRIPCSCWKKI